MPALHKNNQNEKKLLLYTLYNFDSVPFLIFNKWRLPAG